LALPRDHGSFFYPARFTQSRGRQPCPFNRISRAQTSTTFGKLRPEGHNASTEENVGIGQRSRSGRPRALLRGRHKANLSKHMNFLPLSEKGQVERLGHPAPPWAFFPALKSFYWGTCPRKTTANSTRQMARITAGTVQTCRHWKPASVLARSITQPAS